MKYILIFLSKLQKFEGLVAQPCRTDALFRPIEIPDPKPGISPEHKNREPTKALRMQAHCGIREIRDAHRQFIRHTQRTKKSPLNRPTEIFCFIISKLYTFKRGSQCKKDETCQQQIKTIGGDKIDGREMTDDSENAQNKTNNPYKFRWC